MRTTSSSPVNRKSYWKGKSNPSSSNFCKSEGLSFLPRRQSSRTWKRPLIFLDKTCADTLTGNCSSNPPRRTSRPSWKASEGQSKPPWALLPRSDRGAQPKDTRLGQLSSARGEQTHVHPRGSRYLLSSMAMGTTTAPKQKPALDQRQIL